MSETVETTRGTSNAASSGTERQRVMWLSFMDDSYLAGVFRWLKARRVKWLVVNDGRDLWLSKGSDVWEVPDGSWIVDTDAGLSVETPEE